MSISKRVMGALIVGVTLFVTTASADQQIHFNYLGNPRWIHIDEPDVRQAQTFLPIVVYKGDHVVIRAAGCVQTGGHGRTWKRYVNPSGSNAYHLYHGQIQIPGAVESLTNFDQLIGGDYSWSREFLVGAGNPNFAPGQISLGYTDDGYGDNGYTAHDDGTEDQCRGVGNAFVEITICRADPANGPTCN